MRDGLNRHHPAAFESLPFAHHASVLRGNLFDGRALATVIPDTEQPIENGIVRILPDAG